METDRFHLQIPDTLPISGSTVYCWYFNPFDWWLLWPFIDFKNIILIFFCCLHFFHKLCLFSCVSMVFIYFDGVIFHCILWYFLPFSNSGNLYNNNANVCLCVCVCVCLSGCFSRKLLGRFLWFFCMKVQLYSV